MVSKLVLATQENFKDLYCHKGLNDDARALMDYYEALKAGIGVEKTPEQYGAFPTEAYSHTPGFAGVQQPGMTGQVKEDFISRLGELGVTVEDGLIRFKPELLATSEFLTEMKTWSLPRNSNAADTDTIQLDENSLGFTFCAVPVIYYLEGKKKIIVCYKDGTERIFEDIDTLDLVTSQTIFSREGKIDRINVYLDGSKLK